MWLTQRWASSRRSGLEAEDREEVGDVVDLAPAGRRGAAHEVEDLAVLDAVVGQPFDAAILIEIDGDDALIDGLLLHERDRPLGTLGNIVERLTADGRHRGRRTQQDQHLFLARPDWDLLERPFGNDVALLIRLAEATRKAEQQQPRRQDLGESEWSGGSWVTFQLLHSHIPLRSSIH